MSVSRTEPLRCVYGTYDTRTNERTNAFLGGYESKRKRYGNVTRSSFTVVSAGKKKKKTGEKWIKFATNERNANTDGEKKKSIFEQRASRNTTHRHASSYLHTDVVFFFLLFFPVFSERGKPSRLVLAARRFPRLGRAIKRALRPRLNLEIGDGFKGGNVLIREDDATHTSSRVRLIVRFNCSF